MEQQSEGMILSKAVPRKVNNPAVIYATFITIIFLFLLAAGYFIYQATSNVTSLRNQVNSLKSKVTGLENVKKPDDADSTKIDIKALQNSLYLLNLQHRIEKGTVTDDFVVEKVTIIALPPIKEGDKGFLDMTVDVSNQPKMSANYSGYGSYTISDRELKAKLTDVINELQSAYTSKYHSDLPSFKDGIVSLTVQNYELATYSAGSLKLKGE